MRAVIAIVSIGSKLGGTYRFERHDNGEVIWGDLPRHDGEVVGEERGPEHRAPDRQPWRWQLSLAGMTVFARPLEDGRIGLARSEDARFFDDCMDPIQIAPAGEPYRDLVRHVGALIDAWRRADEGAATWRQELVGYIRDSLAKHPAVRSTVPASDRLVRGESVDLPALLDAAKREALREERAYLDEIRTSWEARVLAPSPV